MSVAQGVKDIMAHVDETVDSVRPFRAVVTSVSAGLVGIRRPEASSGSTATYAKLAGFAVAVNDEVLCQNVGKFPVIIQKIQRAAAPEIFFGTGSPEGVQTAPVSSIFIRTDGSAPAVVYIKTSGSGNTGWEVVVTLSAAQTLLAKTLTDPTFNKHLITTGTAPGIAALAAAGSTASVSLTGNDISGLIQVVPGGTGITTGSFLTVTFNQAMPSANYAVLLTPNSSAARSFTPGNVGPTSFGTTSFNLATPTALTSGSTYQWVYHIMSYG